MRSSRKEQRNGQENQAETKADTDLSNRNEENQGSGEICWRARTGGKEMISYETLLAARAALTELEQRIGELAKEHDIAVAEIEEADRALGKLVGLERLGEGDPSALSEARARREKASLAVRSSAAAKGVLAERLPIAKAAIVNAEQAFRLEASELVLPEHKRLAGEILDQASRLGWTLRQFARVDAIAARIPTGTRTGPSLLRAAGDPFETIRENQGVVIDVALGMEPVRLTEREILEIIGDEVSAQ